MSIVIVTGASGYIGGEIALKLKDAGHNVVGIDWRPKPDHLNCFDHFVEEDFANTEVLEFIGKAKADAIVHCAGTSLVGPSMTKPALYYNNNIVKTKALLDTIVEKTPTTRLIFSSSASVYGTPIMVPCSEVDPCEPISPYGESKLMTEWMMRGYRRAYNLDYVAFRYFNAAGADSQGRHGQEPGATHIVARVLESIKSDADFFLYGNNYETEDGTCVRDYVHVEDIADAHILALNPMVTAGVYNIGTATGTSNRQVIEAAENITEKSVHVTVKEKREGDPAILTASPDLFQSTANWQPKYNIEDIITHAWAWYSK
jgi:UDP-glucose 4-epimerase